MTEQNNTGPMTDVELAALTALVEQETVLMAGENALRERHNNSPAYGADGWGVYHRHLHIELENRKLFEEHTP